MIKSAIRRFLLPATLAVATLAAPVLRHGARAVLAAQEQTQTRTEGAGEQPGTTAADQMDLAVTVYNSNVALVRDVRQFNMPSGEFRLRFMDIAASVNPATVHFRSLSDPAKLNVLEQNYEYDLLDPQKLLQKYVGREVTLVRAVTENNTTKWEEVKGTLLADNNGPVWKIGNEIVTGMSSDSMRFPDLPENLYSRPTLLWLLDNSGPRRQRVEASYLTNNISWNADYVLTVSRDDKAADLDGWVTLTNNSGTAFKNARLQLVAGELNRVMPPAPVARNGVVAFAPAAPQMTQEAFSEYHLYTLTRRTTIFDQESKQLSLLNGSGIPVQKAYEVDGQQYYYRNAQRPGAPMKDPVHVLYKFKNDEKSGLGMPLPAGTVRVYQADSKGGVLFAGEDRIDHTPKDELISLHIGNAFDVVAERKQMDYKLISSGTPHVVEMEYEITLRNHKDSAIVVEVNEPIGGDWEMLSSSYKYEKSAAFAAKFLVPVDKDGTSVLKYRVRVKW